MAFGNALRPGSTFAGDFVIERLLAEGGMGAVFVAEQRSTGKRRALKIMHALLVADPRSRVRFVEEARIGSRIESEHVVEVVAAGVDEPSGMPWLAMELLDGSDLRVLVTERGALPPHEVLDIMEQIGHALSLAHARGIVHRDLKPENLFLARSRRNDGGTMVKILDFGIARTLEASQEAATVTSTVGSPLWMAPEQADAGAKLSAATDVWALGLITFFLCTGRLYWRAANRETFSLPALFVEIMTDEIEPPSVRARELGCALAPDFDRWFLRCVDRDPRRRFRNAAEAIGALGPVLRGGLPSASVPVLAPRPRRGDSSMLGWIIVAVVSGAVVLGFAATLLLYLFA